MLKTIMVCNECNREINPKHLGDDFLTITRTYQCSNGPFEDGSFHLCMECAKKLIPFKYCQ